MRSFKISTLFAATALLVSVQADYTIDPSTVPIATREGWCTNQEASCPLLCSQLAGESTATTENTCDATTLDYSCVCANGLSPNSSEYSQTIPYYECETYGDQCVTACGSDSACASACRTDNPCGATSPKLYNTTTTAATATATSSGSATSSLVAYTGFGSSSSSSSSSDTSGAQMAVEIGRSYSLAVVFTGLFAGFALML